MNRNTQTQGSQGTPAPVPSAPHSAPKPEKSGRRAGEDGNSKWYRISLVTLLFCITVLAVAVIGTLWFGNSDQSKYILKDKYQAVFLTNGQVYFGKVQNIGSDFIELQDIFYLQAATTTDKNGNTTQTGNYSLVQLGCQQIHDPYDQMIISRDQVSFWENLQNNGQVVSKINDFKKQYPNGNCSQVSSQTQASTDTTTQNSSNPSTNSSTKNP